MFAIIDCNNFYASCERLFRPDLAQTPIIVLSNNDGCVIARSNEAKRLNIKMGQPYFQIKKYCQHHNITVFSSNYRLYGDISARVMQTIEETWPDIEIYSIDEAFLNLKPLPPVQQLEFAHHLRRKILKHIGIPTSIGIAVTKTLAKAANFLAKKNIKIGVFILEPEQVWLDLIPIEEVWGVGWRLAPKLKDLGIHSAADLSHQSPHQIREKFGLGLMQTTLELQGFPCQELKNVSPKQSIVASKSFGSSQTEIKILAQAISHHCARATEKLRQQQGKVNRMSVFIRTNPFQPQRPQYAKHCHIQFDQATDDLRTITTLALQGLTTIFNPAFAYHKVGVCFEQISYHQQFGFMTSPKQHKSAEFMQVFNAIRNKYGRNSLYLAAEGTQQNWQMKSDQRSPAYTTDWQDLATVKLD